MDVTVYVVLGILAIVTLALSWGLYLMGMDNARQDNRIKMLEESIRVLENRANSIDRLLKGW